MFVIELFDHSYHCVNKTFIPRKIITKQPIGQTTKSKFD